MRNGNLLKNNIICVLVSAFIMIAMPWLTLSVIHGDFGMTVCLMLFYGLNPLTAIMIGLFSGVHIRTSWFQPLLPPVFFMVGVRLFFNIKDTSFLILAIIYLVVGYAVMFIASWAIKRKNR